jgi:hypothetical protein
MLKRVVCGMAGLVMFCCAVTLPLHLGAAEYDSNPYFVEGFPSHTPVSQDVNPFSTSSIEISNANLKNVINSSSFNGPEISGWTSNFESTESVVAGAMDVSRFKDFKVLTENNIPDRLTYFKNAPTNGLGNDNNVFVIGSRYGAPTAAAYEYNEMEFAANSYYIASVRFYAVDAEGSFTLVPETESDLDDKYVPTIKLEQLTYPAGNVIDDNGISIPYYTSDGAIYVDETKSYWRTAYFYIKTDAIFSQKFTLNFSLGIRNKFETVKSGGVIYFQQPKIDRVGKAWFYDELNSARKINGIIDDTRDTFPEKYTEFVDLTKLVENNKRTYGRSITNETDDMTAPEIAELSKFSFSPNIADPDFLLPAGTEPQGVFARANEPISNVPDLLNFETVSTVHLYDGSEDDRRVKLLSAASGWSALKMDGGFLVRRHQLYLITFYSYTAGGSAFKLRMYDKRYDDPNVLHTGMFDKSAGLGAPAEDTKSTNGWVYNTVIVYGDSAGDLDINIEFMIGSKTDNVSSPDYVVIDEFNIERISGPYYNKIHEKNSGLVYAIYDKRDTSPLKNADFDYGIPVSIDKPYPLRPDEWEIKTTGTKDMVLTGIINTDPTHFALYAHNENGTSNYGLPLNDIEPLNGKADNNVLMMQNLCETSQSFSTSPMPLGAGSSNVISFWMLRQYKKQLGFNFYVSVSIEGQPSIKPKTVNLSLAPVPSASENLVSTGWEEIKIVINEPTTSSRNAVLTFNMGDENEKCPASAAFIDKITMKVESQQITSGANVFDFTDIRQSYRTDDGAEVMAPSANSGDDLIIENLHPMGKTVSAYNSLSHTLTSGTTYEYTIAIKILNGQAHFRRPAVQETLHINNAGQMDSLTTDTPNEADYKKNYGYGVNVTINNLGGISNLVDQNTENLDKCIALADTWSNDGDGYYKLKFFIRPAETGAATIKVTFGNDYFDYTGKVRIKEISLNESVSEDDYEKAKGLYDKAQSENSKRMSHMSFLGDAIITDEGGSGDGSGKSSGSPFEWYYIVPTAITAIAVLFALIAFLVRRFRFRLHIDKPYTSYATDDRSVRGKKK